MNFVLEKWLFSSNVLEMSWKVTSKCPGKVKKCPGMSWKFLEFWFLKYCGHHANDLQRKIIGCVGFLTKLHRFPDIFVGFSSIFIIFVLKVQTLWVRNGISRKLAHTTKKIYNHLSNIKLIIWVKISRRWTWYYKSFLCRRRAGEYIFLLKIS